MADDKEKTDGCPTGDDEEETAGARKRASKPIAIASRRSGSPAGAAGRSASTTGAARMIRSLAGASRRTG
jgi:hypothetical protein